MIGTIIGLFVVLVGGIGVYDLQRWCERHDYERHFND
jgi:hypothetical protein